MARKSSKQPSATVKQEHGVSNSEEDEMNFCAGSSSSVNDTVDENKGTGKGVQRTDQSDAMVPATGGAADGEGESTRPSKKPRLCDEGAGPSSLVWTLRSRGMQDIPGELDGMSQACLRMYEAAAAACDESPGHTDMVFVLKNKNRVRGHAGFLQERSAYIKDAVLSVENNEVNDPQQQRDPEGEGGLEDEDEGEGDDGKESQKGEKCAVVNVPTDCSREAFLVFLEYLYTGGIRCCGVDAKELWKLAHMFGMECLLAALRNTVNAINVEAAIHAMASTGSSTELLPIVSKTIKEQPANVAGLQTAVRILGYCSILEDSDAFATVVGGAEAQIAAFLKEHERWEERRGFASVLVGCLRHAAISRVIVRAAIAPLARMVDEKHKKHKSLREQFVEAGGVSALVSAMKARLMDADFQITGCKMMWMIARDGASKTGRRAEDGVVEALTAAMNAHGGNVELLRQASSGIAWMCQWDPDHCRLVAQHGGLVAVVQAMKAHKGDKHVQAHGTDALTEYCENWKEGRYILAEEGGIGAVVGAMKGHRGNDVVQCNGCMVLNGLCAADRKYRSWVVQAGGYAALIAAMEAFKGDEVLQLNSCEALAFLCEGNSMVQRQVAFEKGLVLVLSAMERHMGNVDVQLHGCEVVSNLCNADDEVRSRLLEMGGVGAVMTALEQHTGDADLQERGCEAFANLFDREGDVEEGGWGNLCRIAERGGVKTVVSAIRAHPKDGVAKMACIALSKVCTFDRSLQVVVCREGGVGAILGAMQGCSKNAEVVSNGCDAIAELCDNNQSICSRVACENGVHAIINGMMEHPGNAALQSNACIALSNICQMDEKSRTTVAKERGIGAIISAMNAHTEDAYVQMNGCIAISNLVYFCSLNRSRVAAEDGIDAVVRAMQAHLEDAAVQDSACAALVYLCLDDVMNRKHVTELGGLQSVVEAVKTHQSDPDVQARGFDAIAHILEDDPENLAIFVGEDGISTVLGATKAHSRVVNVQNNACVLLAIMCKDDAETCARIAEQGGVEAVISAMRMYVNEPGIQAHGCDALCKMISVGKNDRVAMRVASMGGMLDITRAIWEHEGEKTVVVKGMQAMCCLQKSLTAAAGKTLFKEGIVKHKVADVVKSARNLYEDDDLVKDCVKSLSKALGIK